MKDNRGHGGSDRYGGVVCGRPCIGDDTQVQKLQLFCVLSGESVLRQSAAREGVISE